MGTQVCFLCKKTLGVFAKKIKFSKLKPIPEGMSENDVLCEKCNNKRIKMLKEKQKELKQQQKLQKTQEKKSHQHCMSCGRDAFTTLLQKQNICEECYTRKYGKTILYANNGEYFGGHKSYLAGGLFTDFVMGEMFLSETYLIFIKKHNDFRKRIEIVIPLNSVIIQGWNIQENIRRKEIVGGGGGLTGGGFGAGLVGGTINESGKSHRIVIPYIDENGIPQEPRFGISSFGGKKIREWSAKVYELVVKNKKENLQAKTDHETLQQQPQSIADEPIKILKLRYAKGEITKEQFETMKKDLLEF